MNALRTSMLNDDPRPKSIPKPPVLPSKKGAPSPPSRPHLSTPKSIAGDILLDRHASSSSASSSSTASTADKFPELAPHIPKYNKHSVSPRRGIDMDVPQTTKTKPKKAVEHVEKKPLPSSLLLSQLIKKATSTTATPIAQKKIPTKTINENKKNETAIPKLTSNKLNLPSLNLEETNSKPEPPISLPLPPLRFIHPSKMGKLPLQKWKQFSGSTLEPPSSMVDTPIYPKGMDDDDDDGYESLSSIGEEEGEYSENEFEEIGSLYNTRRFDEFSGIGRVKRGRKRRRSSYSPPRNGDGLGLLPPKIRDRKLPKYLKRAKSNSSALRFPVLKRSRLTRNKLGNDHPLRGKLLDTPKKVYHTVRSDFFCLQTREGMKIDESNSNSLNLIRTYHRGEYFCQVPLKNHPKGGVRGDGICGKSYTQKCHWVRHCNEVHVEKPARHTCSICGKHYAQRSSLRGHMRREHLRFDDDF